MIDIHTTLCKIKYYKYVLLFIIFLPLNDKAICNPYGVLPKDIICLTFDHFPHDGYMFKLVIQGIITKMFTYYLHCYCYANNIIGICLCVIF